MLHLCFSCPVPPDWGPSSSFYTSPLLGFPANTHPLHIMWKDCLNILKKNEKWSWFLILYAKQDVHLMTRRLKGQLPNLVNNGAITAVIILVTVKSNNCHLAIIRKGRQLEYSPCKFYLESALHPKMSSNDDTLSLITINSKAKRTSS